ncbi:hypothetical protein BXO88_09825 [Oribacterium sp. C9]|uniref:hypothetical protein n=1 Tax=Oribacterium sp. C9 TaxID=1943579 RepID=UPI00098EEC61|nr:hypothetical protein [Oribacterium sp. C9]OON85917.1 hypothetical protein BXO88_09825 [Oribacterium sp. C9]
MVSTAVLAARQAARVIHEANHYDGIFTVTIYAKVKDPVTGLTTRSEQPVQGLTDVPCHLSIESKTAAIQSESAAAVAQVTKLFTQPDVVIPSGSKITVTQAGVTKAYKRSGIPAVYISHQEIVLDVFNGWS